ncbi:acyl-CoA dehydrogenase family protein [Streptomyces sp. NBC_01518]|uniref:acyl-CoA dehydrogenase family protein n=1 Tax=Streptomyces sp. NBC_01518 TaxID=2903891 RepID=UPI0038651536
MDFDLTAEQRDRFSGLVDAVRKQLGSPLREHPEGHFDREEWRTAASLGLTGLCLPAEYGGGGLGALDTALALQAFGRGCPDTGLVFGVAAHLLACATAVRDFADDLVRDELLTGMASGELVGANAITEDEAGSDASGLRTVAVRDGYDYVLDGEKSFASNAPVSDILVTYAVTDPAAGFLGITGFVVPRTLPGIEISTPLAKMGLAGCPAGRVRFTQCRVPARYRLGVEGQGQAVFQHSMRWERTCLFALYVGLMEEQLSRCVAHVRTRRQFGRPLGDFQAISHRIAVMSQRLESARLLLYRACWLMDQGRVDQTAVSLAKVAVSEAAIANGLDAIQIFGGSGYLVPTGIEQQLRDAVPSTLFSGTTEIHREIIAKEAGL